MALIGDILGGLVGTGGNRVKEIAEVFRPNAENADARESAYSQAALQQFGAEFAVPRQGWFDRCMDGLNRLPRPALALGTIGLFVTAMIDPVWFASRMEGIALVPEPMWWLMGAIVSFYFGARSQAKGAEFQRSIAETVARATAVTNNIRALAALNAGAGEPVAAETADETAVPGLPDQPADPSGNAALDDWRRENAN